MWLKPSQHYYKLLFGTKLQVIVKHLESPTLAAETHLKLLEEVRQMAQKLLTHIQNWKDNQKIMEMKEGNLVWLKGCNLSITRNKKLSPKWYGPFSIIKWISLVTFKFWLLVSMWIYNIFHMDLLLPYKEMEAYGTPFTCPPLIIDSNKEYKIEVILDAWCKGQGHQLQYLVHWKGYLHSND